MLTFGIIDDGVGIFPTYYKLRQVVNGNFICLIQSGGLPFNKLNSQQLYRVGKQAVDVLEGFGCDVIALSSVCLSSVYRRLSHVCATPLYYSDAPILHAATYTASNVLVCGDSADCTQTGIPNVIPCVMDEFPSLAEQANERQIVCYIENCIQPYYGKFDCIALASSSMNLYKHCFNRACPNARVFDSLDGVARKIRKRFGKLAREEGTYRVIDQQGVDATEKYSAFFD